MNTFPLIQISQDANGGNLYVLYLTFKSLSKTESFVATSTNIDSIAMLSEELFKAFPSWRDGNAIRPLIYQSGELNMSVNKFVAEYNKYFPHLNKFSAFIRGLEDGEMFFLFPWKGLSQKGSILISGYLEAGKKGIDFEKFYVDFNSLFGTILENYNISTYGENRITIGEPKKPQRKCRFCNKSEPEVTFKSVAHAISEALGNKNVILHEECDACNEKFNKTVEHDLIEYLSLFRTMYKTPGKGGAKQYEGKNFQIFFKDIKEDDSEALKYGVGEKLFIVFEDESNDVPIKDQPIKIPLHSNKQIIAQNIYKCLCKYFLSVIDSFQLPVFQKTIRWVNNEVDLSKLPKVAEFFFPREPKDQPILQIYLRRNKDKRLPYAVGELHFAVIRFVFIVPLSTEDEVDFTDSDTYNYFWETFKHFKQNEDYVSFQDFSDNKKRKLSLELSIVKSKDKNIQHD